MNNSTIKTILCGTAAIFATTAAFATAPSSATQFTPKMMNYQGHLYDPAKGEYTDGTYDIECRIYRQETDGTAIWGGVYTVYVKDGYFNIMLGDTSATNLGCTYSNNELWRALWDDEDLGSSLRNDLWLGITMRQDRQHNNIAVGSRTEITPRQRLLAGPYAFRAQAAHYAKEAKGNFKVGGNITFDSTPWTIGSRFKWDGSTLTLGVTDGSTPNSYSPVVKASGKSINANTWGGIDLKSDSGNITLQASSGHSVNVKDGQFNVSNSRTEINSGSTMLEMTGSTITGIGNLQWAKTSGATAGAPFKIKELDVEFATVTNTEAMVYFDSGNDYHYTVAGWISANRSEKTAKHRISTLRVGRNVTRGWYLFLGVHSEAQVEKPHYKVTVLGIHRGLCDNEVYPAAN